MALPFAAAAIVVEGVKLALDFAEKNGFESDLARKALPIITFGGDLLSQFGENEELDEAEARQVLADAKALYSEGSAELDATVARLGVKEE